MQAVLVIRGIKILSGALRNSILLYNNIQWYWVVAYISLNLQMFSYIYFWKLLREITWYSNFRVVEIDLKQVKPKIIYLRYRETRLEYL